MLKVILKKGRDKPVRHRNPWVFSGAIDKIEGPVDRGVPCVVLGAAGDTLGEGYFNPDSSIAVRMMVFGKEPFTNEVLADRIRTAIAGRSAIMDAGTDSCRLVNSEGDFLPGLVVDKFASGLSLQILTAGMERNRSSIISALASRVAPVFIYEKSDAESRRQEKLEPSEGLVFGSIPGTIEIKENDIRYEVNLAEGQKTGFFLDQRLNRRLIRDYSAGRSVCDCFCYTGGFSCNALAGGARSVTAVDVSAPALEAARRNCALNGFSTNDCSLTNADVFQYLRAVDRRFDLIVLDPPKFAKRQADVEQAARGYKDINLLAIKNVLSGGIVLTFSCSQAIDRKLFRQIVFAAAADSGRDVQVLHTLSQPSDHPVNIGHLEGEYLKGLVLRVE